MLYLSFCPPLFSLMDLFEESKPFDLFVQKCNGAVLLSLGNRTNYQAPKPIKIETNFYGFFTAVAGTVQHQSVKMRLE